MATISCPHCQQHFEIELQSVSQDLQCSVCQGEFEVPAAPPVAVAPARPTLITSASAPVNPNPVVNPNAPANPYATPAAGYAVPQVRMPTFYTGIGRIMFIFMLLAAILVPAFVISILMGPGPLTSILVVLFMVILWVYPFMKRVENMGYHSAWGLLAFVPVVSLLLLIACIILPEGFAQRKRLDAFGAILSILMIAMVVGLIYLVRSAG